MKHIFSILIILLSINLISAPFGYDNPDLPQVSRTPGFSLGEGGGGVEINPSDIKHNELSRLGWSVAGHIIDEDFDIGGFTFKGLYNWTSKDNWNIFDGSTLTFNESKLGTILLKLDQTTPQTIINGVPLLDETPNGNVDLKSFVNKEYVDLAVTSLGASYYMYDEDDATGYKTCYLNPSEDAETYIDGVDLSNDDYIGGWISASGEAPTKLLKGVYDWFITAEKTAGTKTLRVYWKLIERKSDTSEVVIATSSNSNELNGKSSYLIPLQLTEDYIPDSGSRIVGKLYADVSGSGNAPTIRLYYRGDTSSRWEIPANSEIFQNIFVPYNGAVQNIDLGNKNITGLNFLEGLAFEVGNITKKGILEPNKEGISGEHLIFHATGSDDYLDISGHSSAIGTWYGKESRDNGKFGSSYNFLGTNRVEFPSTFSVNAGENITICFWFNTSTTDTLLRLFQKSGTEGIAGFMNVNLAGHEAIGGVSFRTWSGGTAKYTYADLGLNDGVYHHYCGVRDQGTENLYLYIDGILVNSTYEGRRDISSIDRLSIGSFYGVAGNFTGEIDDFLIFDRALSSNAIKSLYEKNTAFVSANAYYPKNQNIEGVRSLDVIGEITSESYMSSISYSKASGFYTSGRSYAGENSINVTDIYYETLHADSPHLFGEDREVGYTRFCVKDVFGFWDLIWWNSGTEFIESNSPRCNCKADKYSKWENGKCIHYPELECKEWEYYDGKNCVNNLYLECNLNPEKSNYTWSYKNTECYLDWNKKCDSMGMVVNYDYSVTNLNAVSTPKCVFSKEKNNKKLIKDCMNDKSKYWNGVECISAGNLVKPKQTF